MPSMPEAVRQACAARDIGAIFRFLVDSGMSQRELAVLVKMYEQTLLQLQALQRSIGGLATRESLAATAKAGEQLLQAEASPEDVHQRLRLLVSDAHRRAGWAAGDVGLVDDYGAHMHAALDLATEDPIGWR
jgi:hypothetical protein